MARQKWESLGVLAGGIAHDFNNLLGGILTNAELALEEIPPDWPARAGLDAIKSVAIRATQIVRQMMAYAGQENAAFETINVSRLVGDLLQLLKVSISKTAVLKIDLPDNIPAVLAWKSHRMARRGRGVAQGGVFCGEGQKRTYTAATCIVQRDRRARRGPRNIVAA